MEATSITLLILGAIALLYPATVCGFRLILVVDDWHNDLTARDDLLGALTFPLVLPLYVAFLVLDVAFNWTWGSYFFRERPHEFLFTSRVERHYRTCAYAGPPYAPTYVVAETQQQREAVYWADWLNDKDPQHVTMQS